MTPTIRLLRTAGALVMIASVWGCDSTARDDCGPTLSELRVTEADEERSSRKMSDYYLVVIAREVPGFGGVRMIRSESGPDTLGIYLIEPDSSAARRVREALAMHQYANHPDPDPTRVERELTRPIKIIPAKYDYPQLYAWRGEIARFVMPIPGVNGAGMRANVTSVGLRHDSDDVVQCVEKRLDELAIPRDAVVIWVTGRIVPN